MKELQALGNKTNKKYLIFKDCTSEEITEMMHGKVKDFLIETFSKDVLDKIEIEINCYSTFENTADDYLDIRITFNEYEYCSKLHGKSRQQIGIILLDKGFKPFYDNGKFFSRVVYECVTGIIFQNDVTEAYGLNTRGIYHTFQDYLLTC